jgi:hypothetical protein
VWKDQCHNCSTLEVSELKGPNHFSVWISKWKDYKSHKPWKPKNPNVKPSFSTIQAGIFLAWLRIRGFLSP